MPNYLAEMSEIIRKDLEKEKQAKTVCVKIDYNTVLSINIAVEGNLI